MHPRGRTWSTHTHTHTYTHTHTHTHTHTRARNTRACTASHAHPTLQCSVLIALGSHLHARAPPMRMLQGTQTTRRLEATSLAMRRDTCRCGCEALATPFAVLPRYDGVQLCSTIIHSVASLLWHVVVQHFYHFARDLRTWSFSLLSLLHSISSIPSHPFTASPHFVT
jgi:hypothetical protein